jgi:hypothetical protein
MEDEFNQYLTILTKILAGGQDVLIPYPPGFFSLKRSENSQSQYVERLE